ncbi:ATP synthase subunit I [Leptothrix ochracea]|uniref:ATP synthase subunit I n=1 Tax=Leptothrix ochracea TaxID=735331 RepID=UPI0034E248C1
MLVYTYTMRNSAEKPKQFSKMERNVRAHGWEDEADKYESTPFKRLSREDVLSMKSQFASVSPWRVVGVQVLVGVVFALMAFGWSGEISVAWSALYGAAAVVVPGVLMARGMTSRLSLGSPLAGAAGFVIWELLKIVVSVVMLMLASRVVQHLSWPVLLVAVMLCMKVYWLALSWRGR